MRRIVVLGARGFFGSAVARALRERGHEAETPTRSDVDVETPASMLRWLRAGDVVVDAAGPFQGRTSALVEAAAAIGFDVIDLSDSLDYALMLRGLEARIAQAGIRILNSCSAVSTVSATLVRLAHIGEPARVSVCLVPASRETTSPGTSRSLLRSVGHSVRVLRDGRLRIVDGWRESRLFRFPLGRTRVRGYLTESADVATLPRVWPNLRQVDFWVDTHVVGLNAVLSAAAAAPGASRLLVTLRSAGPLLARILGSRGGGFVVETETVGGDVAVVALAASRRSYMVAVLPAVLAACALAEDRQAARGLLPPDQHVDPEELVGELGVGGVELVSWSSG